jgi:uncharacterized low-complexity protein
MKNNLLLALLLLSIADASAVAMASPQAVSHNHKSLFQLTEVSTPSSSLISEKGDAKCGAGACGSTKKSKPTEKQSEQKSTEKQHDKTKKSDSKCGAGACGSRPTKDKHSK